MAERGPAVRLTKRVVDMVDLARGRHCIWDAELKGFGVQIEASGTKTYFVRYRQKGLGREGARRFFKLGRHGALTAEEARIQAKAILGAVAGGEDPAAMLARARMEHVRVRDALTVRRLGELFLEEHVKAKRKARTAEGYATLLRKHVFPALGEIKAEQLTRPDLARVHLAMRAAPHTANRMVAVMSSLFSFAQKRELVPEGFNPAKGVEKYREQGRERYLTGEELKRLGEVLVEAETIGLPWQIDAADPNSKHVPKHWKEQRDVIDWHAVAALRLLLLTGARLREILHLRWRYVDLERGLLLLPDSKTGRKTIVLSRAAQAILDDIAQRDQAGRSTFPDAFVIKSAVDGQPRHDLKRPWDAVKRCAGLDGVRLHDLRHTFASIGAGSSLGLPIVGKLLGHSQPQTTARYAHLDADPLRRASDIIGEHIARAMAGAPRSSV